MAIVNHAKREINAKIVYYGPERTGKSTSLRYVYDRIKPSLRGELKSLPASGTSLIFFDFSPFEQPVFDGYRVRLHIYTLQGDVANPAAWKMTLKGADGLVIVTESSPSELSSSRQSIQQLREYLNGYGVALSDMPCVLQLNKSDIYGMASADDMAGALGLSGCQACLTSAVNGSGVLESLTALSRLVMERIGERDDLPQACLSQTDNQTDATEFNKLSARSAEKPSSAMTCSAPLESEFAEGMDASGNPKVADLSVAVAEDGICVDGGTIKIPLDVQRSGQIQRLIVTVTVAQE